MSLNNAKSKHFNLNKKLSWEDRYAGEIHGYPFSGSVKDWYNTNPSQFLDTVKMTKTPVASAVYRHFVRKVDGESYLSQPWKGSDSELRVMETAKAIAGELV